jgi:HSP20 family molecular chaperone IbpA
MSAFFPRTLYGADPSFTPLFRLLDDFDTYSREVSNDTGRHSGRRNQVRAFNPKFDVRELKDSYELHGELPGVSRENISIEFTEPQTLVIRGRVERTYTSGTPPAGALEDAAVKPAITESGEESSTPAAHSHKATVEDEGADNATTEGAATPAETTSTEVAKSTAAEPAAHKEKYWVSERSIGEFSRTFSFPGRVDQEAVSAGLNNGILTVTVPKAKKVEARRIAVN